MKATAAFGKVGKFPIRGTVVNIESADIAPLVNTAAFTMKILVAAGLTAAGVIILKAITGKKDTQQNSAIPIGSLASVSEDGRRAFLGVCVEEKIEFECQGNHLSAEFGSVNSITNNPRFGGYDVQLIDGSHYVGINPITRHCTFITLLGEQKVPFYRVPKYSRNTVAETEGKPPKKVRLVGRGYYKTGKEWIVTEGDETHHEALTINGVSPTDVKALRLRLRYAIANTRESVIAAIGEDVFSHFFK